MLAQEMRNYVLSLPSLLQPDAGPLCPDSVQTPSPCPWMMPQSPALSCLLPTTTQPLNRAVKKLCLPRAEFLSLSTGDVVGCITLCCLEPSRVWSIHSMFSCLSVSSDDQKCVQGLPDILERRDSPRCFEILSLNWTPEALCVLIKPSFSALSLFLSPHILLHSHRQINKITS